MTNQKRVIYRSILKFLTHSVSKAGCAKYKGFKFSFENLERVRRDDEIIASRGVNAGEVAEKKKISRNQVYKVWRRK